MLKTTAFPGQGRHGWGLECLWGPDPPAARGAGPADWTRLVLELLLTEILWILLLLVTGQLAALLSSGGPSAPLQASAVPIVPVTSKRTSCSQAQERDASGIHCPPVLALGGASGEWPEGCVLLAGVLRGGWS